MRNVFEATEDKIRFSLSDKSSDRRGGKGIWPDDRFLATVLVLDNEEMGERQKEASVGK